MREDSWSDGEDLRRAYFDRPYLYRCGHVILLCVLILQYRVQLLPKMEVGGEASSPSAVVTICSASTYGEQEFSSGASGPQHFLLPPPLTERQDINLVLKERQRSQGTYGTYTEMVPGCLNNRMWPCRDRGLQRIRQRPPILQRFPPEGQFLPVSGLRSLHLCTPGPTGRSSSTSPRLRNG